MRTAAPPPMLSEQGKRRQGQPERKHHSRGNSENRRTLRRNNWCLLFLQNSKLLRSLVHFVSLHPGGRLKGASTSTAASITTVPSTTSLCILHNWTPFCLLGFPQVTIMLQITLRRPPNRASH